MAKKIQVHNSWIVFLLIIVVISQNMHIDSHNKKYDTHVHHFTNNVDQPASKSNFLRKEKYSLQSIFG